MPTDVALPLLVTMLPLLLLLAEVIDCLPAEVREEMEEIEFFLDPIDGEGVAGGVALT